MAMHPNNISPRAEFVTYAPCALIRIGGQLKGKVQVDVSNVYLSTSQKNCRVGEKWEIVPTNAKTTVWKW